jgi:hypothetical protein
MTTGGLRYWKDGRDVPDVMLGLFDYAQTDRHPAFNLTLRVDFADGGGEDSGLRLVGSEGVMTVGNDVTLARRPRSTDVTYSIAPFPKAIQDQLRKEHREKHPGTGRDLQASSTESWRPAGEYSASEHHFQNFFASIREGAPMVEDAVFGLRAAGPAVLSNLSCFEERPYAWDPVAMKASPSCAS